MRIEKSTEGDLDVLKLSGEFDSRSAAQFDAEVEALIAAFRTRIVLDLSGLSFMDSAGLTRLIHAQTRLRPLGGELVVAAPPGVVQTTIKTAGIDQLVPMFSDLDEARKHFADPRRAKPADLQGVPVDEAHIGRTEIEFGLAGESGASGTGKLLTVYEDGLLVRYPVDPARAEIEPHDLDAGRKLWLRFRQPVLAPDHEFAMEAEVVVAHDEGDASKYRLHFTKIDEHDRKLMVELAGAQDAIRKYGNPPAQ